MLTLMFTSRELDSRLPVPGMLLPFLQRPLARLARERGEPRSQQGVVCEGPGGAAGLGSHQGRGNFLPLDRLRVGRELASGAHLLCVGSLSRNQGTAGSKQAKWLLVQVL